MKRTPRSRGADVGPPLRGSRVLNRSARVKSCTRGSHQSARSVGRREDGQEKSPQESRREAECQFQIPARLIRYLLRIRDFGRQPFALHVSRTRWLLLAIYKCASKLTAPSDDLAATERPQRLAASHPAGASDVDASPDPDDWPTALAASPKAGTLEAARAAADDGTSMLMLGSEVGRQASDASPAIR